MTDNAQERLRLLLNSIDYHRPEFKMPDGLEEAIKRAKEPFAQTGREAITNSREIVNAIIAGIGSADTAAEQMLEILANLERAGFAITAVTRGEPQEVQGTITIPIERFRACECPMDHRDTIGGCLDKDMCHCLVMEIATIALSRPHHRTGEK